jgi:hypothetical protein
MQTGFTLALAILPGVLLSGGAASRAQVPGPVTDCRHNQRELPRDRERREGALALAKAINAAEGRFAETSRRYGTLKDLAQLPATPEGFELRLYTDRDTYLFSIKDARDVCHYAIFSDQTGVIYEQTPHEAKIAWDITGDRGSAIATSTSMLPTAW